MTGLQERRHQRRLPSAEVEELVLARLAGGQIKDLAQQFDVHSATIQNHLRRHEVPPQRAKGRTLTPDQIQQAGELYESGLSLSAVGKQFQVDKRYLSRVLIEAGLTVRPPGRQRSD